MTVATGDGAPETRSEPLYLRRPLGSGGPPTAVTNRGDRAGVALGVDHRGAEGRSAGREQGLCGDPQRLPAGRHGRRSAQGAADRSLRRRDQGNADRRRRKRRRPSSSICCRPGSRSRRRRCRRGARPTDYSWLPELTDATYTEERDDRFVAALDLEERRQGLHPRLCRARGDRRANSTTPPSSSRTCTSPKPPGAPRSASSPLRRGDSAVDDARSAPTRSPRSEGQREASRASGEGGGPCSAKLRSGVDAPGRADGSGAATSSCRRRALDRSRSASVLVLAADGSILRGFLDGRRQMAAAGRARRRSIRSIAGC